METAQRRGRRGDVARAAIWLALPVTAVLIVARIYLSILNGEASGAAGIAVNVLLDLLGLGFVALGLLVVHRRPGNPVGWIIAGVGVAVVTAELLQSYGIYSLFTEPGRFPRGELAAWLSTLMFVPVLFAAPAMLFLLFPNGRFLSRRWRQAGYILGSTVALAAAVKAFRPGGISHGLQNPLAPGGALGETLRVLDTVTDVLALPAFALTVTGLVVRLRRSRGVERQQLKWFTYAAALVAAGLGTAILIPGGAFADLAFLIGLLALAGLPIAAGMAILKHRLYDIDVIINRTLVYGSLTATLALVYLGIVVLLQRTFVLQTGESSQLTIVASTLAIAALFSPLKRRIQGFADHRFYRQKYDARKTLEGLSAGLRDESDLDALGNGLVSVVRETMQPAHVSLWLALWEGRVER